MSHLTLEQLKAEISDDFPGVWIKDGAEFDADHIGSLWTGEGSEHLVGVNEIESGVELWDMPVFDSYANSDWYEFGVLKEFSEFLRDRGYFAEAYDGGTYFIWKA